jgi:hypothetical protein
MELNSIGNPKNLSFEEVLEILETLEGEVYEEDNKDNPYRPLNFHDED